MSLTSIKIENFLRKKSQEGKSKKSTFSKYAKKERNKLRRNLLKNLNYIWNNNYYQDWEY